jgi:preprotein translocase subunit SecG
LQQFCGGIVVLVVLVVVVVVVVLVVLLEVDSLLVVLSIFSSSRPSLFNNCLICNNLTCLKV